MSRRKKNFLDYAPARAPALAWREEDGTVVVDMLHTGVYAAIAQRLFHRPRVSHIRLDEYGSFLWRRMDGHTDVATLGVLLEAEFGPAVQPLYSRLVQYMRALRDNRFILLKEP